MKNKLLRVSVLIFGLSASVLFPKSIMAEVKDNPQDLCGPVDDGKGLLYSRECGHVVFTLPSNSGPEW